MNKQLVVSIQDLRFATLVCQRCNTRVTMDLNVELDVSHGGSRFLTPRQCPRCESRYDSAVPKAIDALQAVYQALAPLGDAVTFTGEASSNDS